MTTGDGDIGITVGNETRTSTMTIAAIETGNEIVAAAGIGIVNVKGRGIDTSDSTGLKGLPSLKAVRHQCPCSRSHCSCPGTDCGESDDENDFEER